MLRDVTTSHVYIRNDAGKPDTGLSSDIMASFGLHYSTTQIPGHHKLCLIYFFSVEVVWLYNLLNIYLIIDRNRSSHAPVIRFGIGPHQFL